VPDTLWSGFCFLFDSDRFGFPWLQLTWMVPLSIQFIFDNIQWFGERVLSKVICTWICVDRQGLLWPASRLDTQKAALTWKPDSPFVCFWANNVYVFSTRVLNSGVALHYHYCIASLPVLPQLLRVWSASEELKSAFACLYIEFSPEHCLDKNGTTLANSLACCVNPGSYSCLIQMYWLNYFLTCSISIVKTLRLTEVNL